MPLISVLIPAFNAERTIHETVMSALSQTHGELEVVVCDDASEDNTSEIVRSINDSRLRLLRNTANLGEGASRDRTIDSAVGDWLAVLDADDTWHPERLEQLLQAAGHNTNVMVFDDIMVCHHAPNGLKPWRPLRGASAFGARDGMAVDVPAAVWASTWRFLMKPLIPSAELRISGVRHSKLPFSADTEFFLRLVAAGMKLRYVPAALYNYRIAPDSMSSNRNRARLMRDMLEELLPLFDGNKAMLEALQRKIAYRDFTMAIKSGDLNTAWRCARNRPSLISELFARSGAEIPYFLHRRLHGGMRRISAP